MQCKTYGDKQTEMLDIRAGALSQIEHFHGKNGNDERSHRDSLSPLNFCKVTVWAKTLHVFHNIDYLISVMLQYIYCTYDSLFANACNSSLTEAACKT